MDRLATAGSKPGSVTQKQQSHFTAIVTRIKAEVIKIMAWLAVVGGALC